MAVFGTEGSFLGGFACRLRDRAVRAVRHGAVVSGHRHVGIRRIITVAALFLAVAGLSFSSSAAAAPPPPLSPPPPPPGFLWSPSLGFPDEFSADGTALNTALWTPGWFGTGITGPVNGTCLSSANVLLGAGTPNFFSTLGNTLNLWLEPVASRCGKTRSPYTGALVSTNPSDGTGHKGFAQTYGYFEAQIYLPNAPDGTVANWPAWWMDGQVWPQDGEIDIVEGLGGKACFHFHFSRNNPPGGCVVGKPAGNWHTFGVDWEATSITWYYDGLQVGQVTSNVTSSPMYLILNNTQGKYGGTTVVPSDMQVSYVGVWQLAPMP